MNQADYLSAVNPPKYRILGIELRPYSIGHKHILAQADSPFESHEAADEADLMLAVAICSLSYRDGLAFIADHATPKRVKRWFDRLQPKTWFGNPQVKIMDRLGLFLEYLTVHSKSPAWTLSKGGGKSIDESETPFIADVRVSLMRHLHIPEAELMDRCWSLCLWDYTILKEQQDYLRIRDPEKLALAKAQADEYEKALREGKEPMP